MLSQNIKTKIINISLCLHIIFLFFLTTLVFSSDLINFFISWVGLNLSLYGLMSKKTQFSNEMVLKYFLSGSVITIFILMSISIFYINHLNFLYTSSSFINKIPNGSLKISNLFIISILFISVLFKLGSFPFHFYLPDIYESLKYGSNTMFLYTVPLKIAMFFLLIKLLSNFSIFSSILSDILYLSSIGSLSVSSFNLIFQKKLKRFWAFSYLNALGFTLISFSSSFISNDSVISFFSGKVYFIVYIITWFFIFCCFSTKTRSWQFEDPIYISDITKTNGDLISFFSFLSTKYKLYQDSLIKIKTFKLFLFICFLSLMGLPPLIGFFSKTIVYLSLFFSKESAALLVYILLLSPISGLAYLRLAISVLSIEKQYWNKPKYFFDYSNEIRCKTIFMYPYKDLFKKLYKNNKFNYFDFQYLETMKLNNSNLFLSVSLRNKYSLIIWNFLSPTILILPFFFFLICCLYVPFLYFVNIEFGININDLNNSFRIKDYGYFSNELIHHFPSSMYLFYRLFIENSNYFVLLTFIKNMFCEYFFSQNILTCFY